MNKFRFTISALAIAIFAFAFASIAQAQATRTWVSGVGDDVNPCSRTAPCKTFAGAISKTAANGEISVLDPGGFGALTITKAITINGEGTLAGVLSAGTNGFTINAGASDTVNIRFVSINGAGTGVNGIRVLAAKNVNVENCSMTGFTTNGIEVAASANVNLSVVNTTIKNATTTGIRVDTSAGTARVAILNTTITNCGIGLNARRNSNVGMVNSTVALNTTGVLVEGNGGIARAFLKGCQVANNSGVGVQSGGTGANSSTFSFLRLSDNAIHNNAAAGVSTNLPNGIVDSFVNNEIIGNTPDGCPSCSNVSGFLN